MGKVFNLLNDVKILLILFLLILSFILYNVNIKNMKKSDINALKKVEAKLDKELLYWKEKNKILEEKIKLLQSEIGKAKVYDQILKKDFIRYPENETPKVLIFESNF
ncbi:MAG TPA: hypothetical protein EYH39_01950 [Desulfurobacteriaceae bacterium]|nr:hypothetical protein [Desulfurobacteriaceae bacterium]